MPVVRSDSDPAFEQLLHYVRDHRAFDYTGYKRPSLIRRFQKRMEAVGAKTYDDYREYLEVDGREYAELFNTILINVTGFFRDAEAWQFVRSEVIPQILENRAGNLPIRVWSAGCATGEEAYTAAMLLADAMGGDAFRERVKIYATDVDEDALMRARVAIYKPKQIEGLPDDLRERYFQELDGGFVFRNDIRRAVIFGRNDLLQDPPISRVDFLVSRNTLMYFEPAAQQRILANYSFALHRRGFLMLGKAEALQSRTNLFEAFSLKHRVFVRNTGIEAEARLPRPGPRREEAPDPLAEGALREASFDQGPIAQLVVDRAGCVASINYAARAMFGLKASDVSRPLQDLEISYRPVELRSLIEQVQNDRRPVSAREISWTPPDGQARQLDVQLAPLNDVAGRYAGVSISFTDVSRYHTLAAELESARRDLETAYEELQSTVEELETTNEELQSTNEELETTNEELQSTNEELETMNEELQSTNEELEAMNDELRDRTDEALHANSFLGSILWSVEQAVVVVDPQLRVTKWSRAATQLWGLREDEVEGEHLLNLDIGVPVGDLREPIRAALAGDDQAPVLLEGHDRRGRAVRCDVRFAQLRSHLEEVQGVILVMTPEKVHV
jgi:two-component system, chemotaxis family, CheB/CheR fusion protein